MWHANEEKSRKNPTAQTALLAHGGKGKGKDKGDKGKKICAYCKKKVHVKDECRRLKASENKEQKPSGSNSEKEKKELTAKVATIVEQPAESESLRLFVANALAERSSLLVKWMHTLRRRTGSPSV